MMPSRVIPAKAAFADMTLTFLSHPHFERLTRLVDFSASLKTARARTVLRIPICGLDFPSKDFGMAGRPALRGEDLSGLWDGLYSYPRILAPVSFVADLKETGGWRSEEHT